MADKRDPRLVELLEGRIRNVFGRADIKVGQVDFSGGTRSSASQGWLANAQYSHS